MGSKVEKPEEKSTQDVLFETIFEFKMQAKQLAKESKKADREKEVMIEKVKTAFSNNKPEAAKLYAQDAIRKRNEAIKYEQLSYKLEAVHSKLKSAYQAQKLNDNINGMVTQMAGAVKTMDLEKISENMSNFEKIFDDLDANTQLMDKAMENIDAGSYEDQDVNTLIMQVAQANNIELSEQFNDIKKNHDPLKVNAMKEKMNN